MFLPQGQYFPTVIKNEFNKYRYMILKKRKESKKTINNQW